MDRAVLVRDQGRAAAILLLAAPAVRNPPSTIAGAAPGVMRVQDGWR
jgi:hypothetical protein